MDSRNVDRAHFEDWNELRDQILHDASDGFIWRGVPNSTWCIHSSLDRFMAANFIRDRGKSSARLLALYRKYLAELEDTPSHLDSEEDLWALGQHWGLPTPLIDWSYSPMVAVYFAVTSADSGTDPSERVSCLWRLDISNNAFSGPGDVEILTPSAGPWNRRLKGQQGLFTKVNIGGCLVETLTTQGYVDKLKAYTFPFCLADIALRDLKYMTIDDLQLFPDFLGVIRFITAQAIREGQRRGK